jgi:hypothetical protein
MVWEYEQGKQGICTHTHTPRSVAVSKCDGSSVGLFTSSVPVPLDSFHWVRYAGYAQCANEQRVILLHLCGSGIIQF